MNDYKALTQIRLHLYNNILQEVPTEKTATTIWLKLGSLCMKKDLTSKMRLKQKLFKNKLQEVGDLFIFDFKEIVSDLGTLEIRYFEEDLGLILLCSIPSSCSNLRDTIPYSRVTLTLHEVYEALYSKEKMKQMVFNGGSSSLQCEGLPVQDVLMKGILGAKIFDPNHEVKKSLADIVINKVLKFSKCYKLHNKEKMNASNSSKGNDDSSNYARDNNFDGRGSYSWL